jgi:hypothetical protein
MHASNIGFAGARPVNGILGSVFVTGDGAAFPLRRGLGAWSESDAKENVTMETRTTRQPTKRGMMTRLREQVGTKKFTRAVMIAVEAQEDSSLT